ncbi:MAG: site-2 protease family protein [Chloroflexi bacterium]|nr:site-2 protease family protein [Chloroflexota bacterium]
MNPIQALLDSGASMLVVIPIFLALLSLIVFVHELGHYAFARRFGVGVHTFAIGLPPRLWSRLRGDDAIPAEPLAQDAASAVDGAVRLVGASDPDDPGLRNAILLYCDVEPPTRAELRAAQAEGAAGAILAVPPELTVHLSGAESLALPVVRVDPETGTAIAARLRHGELQAELRRGRQAAFDAAGASIHLGGTRFAINALPLGGYVRLAGESNDFDAPQGFARRKPWQRAVILVAGPLMNFLLAPILFMLGSLIADEVGARIVEVAEGSPAQSAGLLADDRILAVDGAAVASVSDLIRGLDGAAGQPVTFEIRRGSDIVMLRAVPRIEPPPGEGPLGIRIGPVRESAPLHIAAARGVTRTIDSLALVPLAIGEWIAGGPVQVAGPVGIAAVVDQAARLGLERVLFLGAILSAQIGLINLFPWPGLDGGRLVFVGFEWLTGRRLSPRREAAFHFVGIMLLMALAVVITVSDVQRLAGF